MEILTKKKHFSLWHLHHAFVDCNIPNENEIFLNNENYLIVELFLSLS